MSVPAMATGLLPHFVERFEHRDMRDAARAPPPPSASAKLFAHGAPASRANVQALTASGRTSGAMAAAVWRWWRCAVAHAANDALQRMAARRKKLSEHIGRQMGPGVEPGCAPHRHRHRLPAWGSREPAEVVPSSVPTPAPVFDGGMLSLPSGDRRDRRAGSPRWRAPSRARRECFGPAR